MKADSVYLQHIADSIGVQLDRVWQVVERDLADLEAAVFRLLSLPSQ